MEVENIIKDDLRSMNFLGEVVDISDPRKQGRVKVKVYGKFDDLETEDIPWAHCEFKISGSSTGAGAFSLPKIGSIVSVRFDNGNLYHPIYMYHPRISEKLLEELSDDDEYENAQVLLFDDEQEAGILRIWYTPKNGIRIELDTSIINIREDKSISLQSESEKMIHIKKDKISIGSEDESDEPAVLGDKAVDALNAICDKVTDLCDKLFQFATTQASASAQFYTSPLVTGFSKLIADVQSVKAQIAQVKSLTVPKIRSSSVTLDGPPKN